MAINKDLNVSPYFDDFDETKQYHRVLFKPARPVQARELTQLQTILQNQIERFGSNIFKEGTIISGTDIYDISDLKYVKLDDDVSGISGVSVESFLPRLATTEDAQNNAGVSEDDYLTYTLEGGTTRLVAEIVNASEGFVTRNPDLKTFFIKYRGTTDGQPTGTLQDFDSGEELTIRNPFGGIVGTITVSTLVGFAGTARGVGVSDGVIYQKGHFLYVEPQTIIISKYTEAANNISVGFDVEEILVNSNQDESLLDNSQGFLNKNAPGADRLRLRPFLVSHPSTAEPENFFALARYKNGIPTQIRNVTEFNSIEKEMSRRTFDQSGNYVSRGMRCAIEAGVGDEVLASVSPGTGYSSGYELTLYGHEYFTVDPVTEVNEADSVNTSVQYGNYLTIPTQTGLTIQFDIEGGVTYNLYTSNDVVIGQCNVRNVEDGRIYIYNVRMATNLSPADTIAKIGNSPADAITITGGVTDARKSPMIFGASSKGVKSVSEISFARRIRLALSGTTPTNIINLPYGGTTQPINNDKIVVINQVNQQISVQTRTVINDGQGNPATLRLQLTENITPSGSVVYFDQNTFEVTPNSKTTIDMFVKTNYDGAAKRASLGVPDAYRLLNVSIFRTADQTIVADVTDRFKLGSNQKDTFYDISYIELKGGNDLSIEAGQVLLVQFKTFRHDYTSGGGFFTAESYVNIPREDIPVYNASNGTVYDLVSSFDFRVAIQPNASYSISAASASTALDYADLRNYDGLTSRNIETGTLVSPSNNSNIRSKIETYLSRIDQIVIDSSGNLTYRKGKPAKTPSVEITPDLVLAEIVVPSNPVRLKGPYAPRLKNKGIKAYTMRDISKIESQIDRLIEISALSMLKTSADDMIVTDSAGLDRFKNGVMVDTFKNLKIADVNDPEFFAGVDQFRERATPPHKQFPIYLKRGAMSNAAPFSEIITKATDDTETLLSQPAATTYRNAVFGSYKYIGSGELHPRYDSGYDMTVNPAPATINIDMETPILELADNIMELMSMTGADTRVVTTDVTQRNERTVVDGQAGTNLVTTISEEHTKFDLTSTSKEQTQVVGQFLTDANFRPFMESREIKILMYGLRPNVRHYFYFEQDDINAMVKPGANVSPSAGNVRASQVVSGGNYGDPVYSNSSGVLTAVFKLPAETYLVGDRKLEIASVDQYASIASAGDSYASLVYSAHNFDVNSQVLTVNTRTAEFDVAQAGEPFPSTNDFISRFTPDPPPRRRDPLAQTFYLQRSSVEGNRYVYLDSVELFFKSKSSERGVNIEIREVINGFPARQIVPFGHVHYDPNDENLQDIINTSDDGSAGTLFRFNNPVRLETEREYCVVVRPDANDPGYNLFTAKLGERDLQTNRSITADWGDGVLFSSTNNLTWVPHADEDLKFNVNIHTFTTDATTIEFKADDMEFFTISSVTGAFEQNEIAFTPDPTTTVDVGIFIGQSDTVETSTGADVNIQVGQYAVLQQNLATWVSKVISVNGDQLTLAEPSPFAGPATMTRALGGIVSNFNKFRPNSIDLRKSTAQTGYSFIGGQVLTLYGATSGAIAIIDSVDDVEMSSIQGHMYKAESQNALVDFDVYNGPNREGDLPLNDNYYFIDTPRVVESTSNIVAGGGDNFSIIGNLKNTNRYTTPIVDDDISMLFGYKYLISNDENTTAKWVTREVTLNSDLYAEGIRVRAGIHRPQGSDVKVYAKFKYRDNIEEMGDWLLLENETPDLYSSSTNLYDYREFDFNLPEAEEREYVSFKLKFVMLADSVNRTPSMIDYRAIAVT